MHRIQGLINDILSEKTKDGLLDRLHATVKQFGVEYFILVRFSRSGDFIKDWIIGGRAPKSHLEHYLYKDHPQDDPLIHKARMTVEPFFLCETIADDKARLAHIRKGCPTRDCIIIPVPGPRGLIGIAWMTDLQGRESIEKYKAVLSAIGTSSYYALQKLLDPDDMDTTTPLSKKESAILNLVADGLSSHQIAYQLHKSDRTVEWHLQRIMEKLQARNRIQAVVLAIRDGFIPL
jgi:LuxR family transcriptional regulator